MKKLKVAYETVLREYLSRHRELDLARAYDLGKRLQEEHVSPDEIVGLHLSAIEGLSPDLEESQRYSEVIASFSVLIETMIAYGIAYSDALRLLERASLEVEASRFELERTIAELHIANKQLQHLDQLKNQFFANMSHELRTPLNAIIGFAEDAIDGLAGELNARQQTYLTHILVAGRHLLSVINDILDLAKLQSGKVRLDISVFPLQRVFDEIAATLEPMVKRKHQSIEAVSEVPTLAADRPKVFQILLNLVSNAHKFTPEGGHIKMGARRANGGVEVEVKDDGIGIPETDIPFIFEEFRQADLLRKPKQQGTGLGLSITRRLVEMHGGRIQLESKPGKGTRVWFNLPLPKEAS